MHAQVSQRGGGLLPAGMGDHPGTAGQGQLHGGDGVTRFKAGDEVFGMPWFPRAAGAYAQFATAPARLLALKPPLLSHEHAAALPLAGLTAWQMLVEVANVGPGQRVLINGGAGGVGDLAIQVAKSQSAYVIATAREPKHAFL